MTPPPHAALHIAADEVSLELNLADGDPAFVGHFPGRPVLAGVIQLDWAMQFAARYLGIRQRAADDLQVKFRRVIPPGRAVVLALRHDRAAATLGFEYRLDGEVASLGRIRVDAA